MTAVLSLSLKQTGLLWDMHNSACDVLCFKIILPGAMEEVSVIVTEPQTHRSWGGFDPLTLSVLPNATPPQKKENQYKSALC